MWSAHIEKANFLNFLSQIDPYCCSVVSSKVHPHDVKLSVFVSMRHAWYSFMAIVFVKKTYQFADVSTPNLESIQHTQEDFDYK